VGRFAVIFNAYPPKLGLVEDGKKNNGKTDKICTPFGVNQR